MPNVTHRIGRCAALIAFLVITTAAMAAPATRPASRPDHAAINAELLSRINALLNCLITADDRGTGEIYADDYTLTKADGTVIKRTEALKAVADPPAPRVTAIDLKDVQIDTREAGKANVQGLQILETQDDAGEIRIVRAEFTQTWVLIKGTWRLQAEVIKTAPATRPC